MQKGYSIPVFKEASGFEKFALAFPGTSSTLKFAFVFFGTTIQILHNSSRVGGVIVGWRIGGPGFHVTVELPLTFSVSFFVPICKMASLSPMVTFAGVTIDHLKIVDESSVSISSLTSTYCLLQRAIPLFALANCRRTMLKYL